MLALTPFALALLPFAPQEPVVRDPDPQVAGTVRVVDAATGGPVAGAIVYGLHEASAPTWGEFWFEVSAKTDAEGWAALPPRTDQRAYQWMVVRADDYAIHGDMEVPREGWEPVVVNLHRTKPAEFRLVDFLNRPVPLVHLGLCVGCGHTPDVATAVTDRDGRATILGAGIGDEGRDIADLYPVGEGVVTDYTYFDWDDAMNGGVEVRARPGRTIEGQMFLADGSPAVGWSVGEPRIHRGPWATCDEDGRFRLHGMERDTSNSIVVMAPDGRMLGGFEAARTGIHRIVRLDEDIQEIRPEATGQLRLEVRVAESDPDADELPRVPYEVWDPTTGWSDGYRVDAGGDVELQLAPGTYEVEVGGGRSPYPRRHLGTIQIDDGGPVVELLAELPAVRVARLEVLGIGDAKGVYVINGCGSVEDYEFDDVRLAADGATRIGVIESFLVPASPFGLWMTVNERGRDEAYLETDGLDGDSAVLTARRQAQ